jgi:hypothetical protein
MTPKAPNSSHISNLNERRIMAGKRSTTERGDRRKAWPLMQMA